MGMAQVTKCMCIHLQLKKTKVHKVILAINMAGKALDALYTTNETEHFSFRSRRVCCTGGEMLKRRLARSITILIAA